MDYKVTVVDKLILLIRQKDEFPLRTEDKINELIGIYYHRMLDGDVSGINPTFYDDFFKDIYNHVDTDPYFNNNDSLKLIKILMHSSEYSSITRLFKIDPLVEQFLTQTKDDIHDMLDDDDGDDRVGNYHGLDSDRDTKKQVEIMVRFFPEVLSRIHQRLGTTNNTVDYYPIQLLAHTKKAVSFVPLVSRLAIELGVFGEDDRGGLLCGNISVCVYIVNRSTLRSTIDKAKYYDVMKPMVNQKDLQRYEIWDMLSSRINFRDNRFRGIVNENPSVLKISTKSRLSIPLYYAAQMPSSIRQFKLILQTGIQYYPNKGEGVSLLFKMVNTDKTPFQIACERFGRDEVMDAVEGTLLTFQYQQLPLLDDDGNNNNNNNNNNTNACGPPYNLAEALIAASVNEHIHLDCVFFLIRRHPNVLKELLVVAPAMEGNDNKSNNKNNVGGRGDDGGADSADGADEDEDDGGNSVKRKKVENEEDNNLSAWKQLKR
jgi:hypothetical protein